MATLTPNTPSGSPDQKPTEAAVLPVAPAVAPTPAKKASSAKAPARTPAKVAKKSTGTPVSARKTAPKASAAPVPAPSATKAEKPPKPGKSVKADKPAKPPKAAKIKMVRDSFTMPSDEWALIDQVKLRALEWRMPVKKSEVLRAALHALMGLSDARLKETLAGLAPIKKGRPSKA